ncbi:MAG: isoprenylcysteine carboxylmethyltransferase family protein [Vicinamibacterales bacterium]|nr:isoprenylcysteine carboxylmethyltransferase family protein [Vicinamibacterales bacterium]
MTILEQFLQDGDRLFRWRSHFPLVLVPVLVAGVFLEGQPFGAPGAERTWELIAVAVALAGLAIRAWAVGTAPLGTSERSTVNPRASELRTSGLYSIVRHPLYLANGLMALGIGLFPGVWYLPPMVVMGTLLYYERIAAREEQFLDGLFGPAFREWASRVPAIVPRVSGWVPSTTAVSWRKILRGECYGLLVITASVFVLDMAQSWSRSRTFRPDPLWAWVFVATAAMFLVARTLKKTTRILETGD